MVDDGRAARPGDPVRLGAGEGPRRERQVDAGLPALGAAGREAVRQRRVAEEADRGRPRGARVGVRRAGRRRAARSGRARGDRGLVARRVRREPRVDEPPGPARDRPRRTPRRDVRRSAAGLGPVREGLRLRELRPALRRPRLDVRRPALPVGRHDAGAAEPLGPGRRAQREPEHDPRVPPRRRHLQGHREGRRPGRDARIHREVDGRAARGEPRAALEARPERALRVVDAERLALDRGPADARPDRRRDGRRDGRRDEPAADVPRRPRRAAGRDRRAAHGCPRDLLRAGRRRAGEGAGPRVRRGPARRGDAARDHRERARPARGRRPRRHQRHDDPLRRGREEGPRRSRRRRRGQSDRRWVRRTPHVDLEALREEWGSGGSGEKASDSESKSGSRKL
jgi:hypothetical protein